jgi:hypothetical protein
MSVPHPQWLRIRPRGQCGQLGENEKWWAEWQEVLEQAGYMLRPRYRSNWKPSWAGTNKSYLDFEDGQPQIVSANHSSGDNQLTALSTVWLWTRSGSLMGNT